jgi:hypothetical protein
MKPFGMKHDSSHHIAGSRNKYFCEKHKEELTRAPLYVRIIWLVLNNNVSGRNKITRLNF